MRRGAGAPPTGAAVHPRLPGQGGPKGPPLQRLLSLLPEGSLHPGFMVCRCVLKDCLPMDESFLGWIEAHPLEKLCGEYAPGRFAWVLEQVEPLEAPVAAKGHLSLWEWEPPP